MALVPPAGCLLATLPEYPSFGDSVAFQFTGLLVVFFALGTIWAAMEIIGRLFRRRPARKPALAPAKPAAPAAAPAPAGQLPGEIVAAIVAAVSAEFEQPHRIAAIMPVEFTVDWAREGRREIFASHKTR